MSPTNNHHEITLFTQHERLFIQQSPQKKGYIGYRI